jgi:thioredoxin-related protein
VQAQAPEGMIFTKAKSWEEVKAIAKAEGKHIFLDGYTTWCGPCKVMATKIFPQKSVGDFFNKYYINLKVQLDTTAKDSDEVKGWYKDAHYLMTNYKINVFPTYLFFSPDGELVHREIGSSDAETFIQKGKNALDPEKQYYTLLRRYEQGQNDPDFLRKLSIAAWAAYDRDNAKKFVNAYLATQSDLFTPENIKFLSDFTQSTQDPGFKIMLESPAKIDAIKGAGFADRMARRIILQEEVFPEIFKRGSTPAANATYDWAGLETRMKGRYPTLAEQIVTEAKIFYYQQNRNWPEFSKAVTTMTTRFPGSLDENMLNSFAWTIFEECEDIACVKQALGWSKESNAKGDNPMFLDTYANLLHKTGDTKAAIKVQKKAIKLLKKSGEDYEEYQATLSKMEKGEKTWN